MKITNSQNMSLPLAVWALYDEYDYVNTPDYVSATTLMKPLRQLILSKRIQSSDRSADVMDFIARASGHAYHDSIEKAWTKGYARSLKLLGYPEAVIERVRINPEEDTLTSDCIPIYMEQRATKKVGKYTIGGKFDLVAEGIVQDYKTTSTFTWVKGGRDEEHQLQGSLYAWLNPTKITEDFIRINYIFTDWQKFQVKANPNYPPSRVMHKDIPLLTHAQTEAWVVNKLAMIDKYINEPDEAIPECTDAELWRSDPQYKYYADPKSTQGRSTKNFTSLTEAMVFFAEKGSKGIVKTVLSEPKRCGYCDAYDICKQKDRYFHE